MIRLNLVNVGVLPDSGSVVLVMRAPEMSRLLIMDIGPFEGRAIAMGASGVEPPRPMTHDLLVQTLTACGAKVQHVFIREFKEQTFFATLTLETGDKGMIELDSRPSDAVACAVRTGAPIFVDEKVLAAAGVREEDVQVAVEEVEDAEDEDADTPLIH